MCDPSTAQRVCIRLLAIFNSRIQPKRFCFTTQANKASCGSRILGVLFALPAEVNTKIALQGKLHECLLQAYPWGLSHRNVVALNDPMHNFDAALCLCLRLFLSGCLCLLNSSLRSHTRSWGRRSRAWRSGRFRYAHVLRATF